MGLIYILSAVFILASFSQGSWAQNDAFRGFLVSSMAYFPAWLQAKNYDPTPILPNPVNLTYLASDESYGFCGAVKNQRVSGLAGPATYGTSADLSKRDFALAIYYTNEASRNMTVEGEYNTIGFLGVNTVTKIVGSGKMYLSDQTTSFYFQLNCNGFGITPEGFVDLSQADISFTHPGSSVFGNKTLEGLRANGQEDFVTVLIIEDGYYKYNDRNLEDWFPLGGYMREYLDEVFASISYDEIIKLGYQPK